METAPTRGPTPHLLPAGVATAVVVGLPCALVFALRAWGPISAPLLLIAVAVALSTAISQLGAVLWKRRAPTGDLIFRDLMLWGWIRRRRFERRLVRVPALVGPNADKGLSTESRMRLLERLSRALEADDPHTHGHSRRVARHAAALARWMSLQPELVAKVRTAALLHDVGKIETPRQILEKPGKLTEEEYEVVKRHAMTGAAMVSSLEDHELTEIVRHHHERIDGGGYPDGLAAEEIPLGARIVAVADTFDAVTSARSYRTAMSHKQALALLDDEAGTQLDPRAVRAFRSHYSGTGPVAVCAGILSGARQLGESLLAQLGPGAGAAKVAAVAAATVAVGATALQPSVHVPRLEGARTSARHGFPSPAPRSHSSPRSGGEPGGSPVRSSGPGSGNGGPQAVSNGGEPSSGEGPSVGSGAGSQPGGGSHSHGGSHPAAGGGGSAPTPSAEGSPHVLAPVPTLPAQLPPPVESVVEGVNPPSVGGVNPTVP
jgi:putative nucleotidyltransferase with HDIG domain